MASGIGFSLDDFRVPSLIVNPFFAPVFLVAGVFVVYLYTYTPPLEGCDLPNTLRRAKRTGSVPRGNVQAYSYTQPKKHRDSGTAV